MVRKSLMINCTIVYVRMRLNYAVCSDWISLQVNDLNTFDVFVLSDQSPVVVNYPINQFTQQMFSNMTTYLFDLRWKVGLQWILKRCYNVPKFDRTIASRESWLIIIWFSVPDHAGADVFCCLNVNQSSGVPVNLALDQAFSPITDDIRQLWRKCYQCRGLRPCLSALVLKKTKHKHCFKKYLPHQNAKYIV